MPNTATSTLRNTIRAITSLSNEFPIITSMAATFTFFALAGAAESFTQENQCPTTPRYYAFGSCGFSAGDPLYSWNQTVHASTIQDAIKAAVEFGSGLCMEGDNMHRHRSAGIAPIR